MLLFNRTLQTQTTLKCDCDRTLFVYIQSQFQLCRLKDIVEKNNNKTNFFLFVYTCIVLPVVCWFV